MRISDWSSDVCSSDLPTQRTKKMGGSRKSRPSFLQSLVLEVDLRADAEVTTHDVRTSPGRIEAEQAIGRVGIERRLGVEQVEHVRIEIGRAPCRERVCQYV